MSKLGIIEGNVKIARFYGWDVEENSVIGALENGNEMSVKDLAFDNCWDDLMTIVEIIEQMEFEVKESVVKPKVEIHKDSCIILDDQSNYFAIVIQKPGDKIKAVWKAVIEFIEWYNRNVEQEQKIEAYD